jgi:hypothetical protein
MSNVRSNNFFDPTGNYGIKPNSDDGFAVSVLGWEFKDSGGSLYPLNKTKVVFINFKIIFKDFSFFKYYFK